MRTLKLVLRARTFSILGLTPLRRKVKASVVFFRKILLSVTKNCEKDYKITNERNKQKCLYFSLLNNLT